MLVQQQMENVPLLLMTPHQAAEIHGSVAGYARLVEADKSMSAMIHNDVEKEWMMPLLELVMSLIFARTIRANILRMQIDICGTFAG